MKRCWSIVLRVLVWGGLAAFVGLGVMSTKQTLSYSSVCTRCLATRSGLERSILGIPYEEKFRVTCFLYETSKEPIPAMYSEGRQTIYEEIHGKPCDHDFARIGFCRYRGRGVGCGTFGGSWEVRGRNQLLLGAFTVFERIHDKELAARSCELIEREFPFKRPQRTGGQNLIKDAEDEAERGRRMSLLGGLLEIVRNEEDWASVLDYVAGGFRGNPPILLEEQALIERLKSGKPAGNATAASILAERSATSNELLQRMMKDEKSRVASCAKFAVIQGKRLELFGDALAGYKLSDPQKEAMRSYSTEDFERLLALGDKTVDEVCAEAIWYTDHFELLELMMAMLNHHDFAQGRETVEKLLRGGNPYSWGATYDADYMLTRFPAERGPMKKMRETISRNLREAKSGLNVSFYESVRGIGAANDPTQWQFLKDSYLTAANEDVNVWALAALARAMNQLDARATEKFLIDEMRKGLRFPAAISSMGFIGSGKFAPALEEFAARPRPTPLLKDNLPKNFYDADGGGTALLAYALHRCRGIPSWKLVKNAEGRYVIEKPPEISR